LHICLAGIRVHTTEWIRLAPRWAPLEAVGKAPPLLFPTQRHYYRSNVGWKAPQNQTTLKGEKTKIIEIDESDKYEDWAGQLVDSDDTDHPIAGALVQRLFSEQLQFRTLAEALGRYFPLIPPSELESYEYPMPMSDEFWHQYAESVEDFRRAIRGVKEIIKKLAQTGPLELLSPEMVATVLQGRAELHSLLSVSPGVSLELDGSYTPKWAFSSMLALMGFAIWQKLVAGESLKHCMRLRCRGIFFTKRNNKRYCSDRCRMNEEKARQRRKKLL